MLDEICQRCEDMQVFCVIVWNILLSSPSARLSATNYVLLHLARGANMAKAFQSKDESTVPLVVSDGCEHILENAQPLQRKTMLMVVHVVVPCIPLTTKPTLVPVVSFRLATTVCARSK